MSDYCSHVYLNKTVVRMRTRALAMMCLASRASALLGGLRQLTARRHELLSRMMTSAVSDEAAALRPGDAPAPSPRRPVSITDAIHRTIELHPLCAAIMDTPEFQRLRGVKQLGVCSHVFPCAVHDRFQHSLGVSHLAGGWAQHFRAHQPQLNISDADILCVAIAVRSSECEHPGYSARLPLDTHTLLLLFF